MAWKTISVFCKVSNIVKVLQDVLGYSVTNIKNILVNEFGYKTTKDILTHISISKKALYTPLVYRDKLGYSTIIELLRDLLKRQESGEIKRIFCYHFEYYESNREVAIYQFRAEHVYEVHLYLILKQNKFINYESPYYLP